MIAIRNKLTCFVFVGVLSLGSLAACGGPPSARPPAVAAPMAPAAPAATVKEPGEAKVGDKTKCTVTGEEMTAEASSLKSEYQGKTYFFCCGGCKKKFDADPAKYIKKS